MDGVLWRLMFEVLKAKRPLGDTFGSFLKVAPTWWIFSAGQPREALTIPNERRGHFGLSILG